MIIDNFSFRAIENKIFVIRNCCHVFVFWKNSSKRKNSARNYCKSSRKRLRSSSSTGLTVWKSHMGALLCMHTMLVLDSFCGHIKEKVRAKLYQDSDLVVFPSGMSKLLYPVDVVINQPLKVNFWWLCNQWMIVTKHEFRPSTIKNGMQLLTAYEWILEVW